MTPEQRRKLGAYYTPEPVTAALCSWAIKNSTDIILEPSFGGCNFLTSSLEILRRLGNENPEQNIFGFDIDTGAFQLLKEKGIENNNFILGDFLHSDSLINNISVDVILGNPPYLPIHKLDLEYKNNLYKEFKKNEIKIPKRSSLWVYFIVHSFQYLKLNGSMAWVVPDSIAFTDYGKHLLKVLANKFKSVQILRTDERYFYDEGTYEKTALLLCKGYGLGTTEIEIFEYNTLAEVLKAMQSKRSKKSTIVKPHKKELPRGFDLIKLGDVFTTRIGIVIGATKLLAFKKSQAFKSIYYPSFFYPMITKGKQLKNLKIDRKELLKNDDLPVFILDVIKLETEAPEMFKKFLEDFPAEILTNQTFKNRQQLFGYDDFNHPEAFLTYFSQGLPKLVINGSKELNCTNSVHRLYLKEEFVNRSWIMKFIAIQLYCEFLQDEIIDIARQYGNKINKYEPSDAQKIPILIPCSHDDIFIEELDMTFEKMVLKVNENKSVESKQLGINYLKRVIKSFSEQIFNFN